MNSQNLQILKVGYNSQSHSSVLSPGPGQQLKINSITLFNGGTNPSDIAVGVLLDPNAVKVQQFDSGSGLYTDLDLASPIMIFDNSGTQAIAVRALHRFDQIRVNLPTFSPTHSSWSLYYGQAEADVSLLNSPTTTGEASFVFNIPSDWAPDNEGYYTVHIYEGVATNFGQTTVSAVSTIRHIAFRPAIGANQQMQVNFPTKAYKLESEEEIIPYFKNPDNKNMVEISYQIDS